MKKDIILLKENQEKLEKLKSNLELKKEEFEYQNTELIQSINGLSINQDYIKDIIKIKAIQEFDMTGEKKLYGGIGIRILNKLTYEEADAIKWAETNMPVAISKIINKKQFETFAKTSDLDFVEKEEKISVTFPKEIVLEEL